MLTHNEQVLSFGVQQIDDILGGFRQGDFAVLYGHPYCKALIFQLCVRCQLPIESGGLDSSAIFVDGGNSFNPYAVSAIAREYCLNSKTVLEHVFVSRGFTAYQLSALIFETLEGAVKQYRSKLVLISDITSLFLDRDVPAKEAAEIFSKATAYLSNLAVKRSVIVVATCFPHVNSKRQFFFESALFEKASTITRIAESKGRLQFTFENHKLRETFMVDVVSNRVTLDKWRSFSKEESVDCDGSSSTIAFGGK